MKHVRDILQTAFRLRVNQSYTVLKVENSASCAFFFFAFFFFFSRAELARDK